MQKTEIDKENYLSQANCVGCQMVKPLSEFYLKNNRPGRRCRLCLQVQAKERRDIGDRLKKQAVRSSLMRNYGIETEEYNHLWIKQNGVCAICQKPESEVVKSGVVKRLSLDHCHKTGKVRALLCGRCNKGLGLFNDDVFLVREALLYLKRYG